MEILARQTYNRLGKLVNSKTNYSSNGLLPHEMVAKLTDQSYRKMNRFPTQENRYKITFGPFVAITETIAACSLVWCFRSIATVLNLLMTLGEFGQTWVAGLDPNEKKIKQNNLNPSVENSFHTKSVEDSIESKESGMAWFQVLAGTGGVLGMAYEFLAGEKEETAENEVSFLKKVTLSATSALNVFFMLGGAAEKSLMSMLSWNGGGKNGKGQDYRSMQINGAADVRGAIEWAFMTVVPWISNVNSLKHVVDIAVTYGALREGADYFHDSGKMKLAFNGNNMFDVKLKDRPVLKKLIEIFVNPFSIFAKGKSQASDEKQYNLCWPFNSMRKWYLGSETDKDGPGSSGFRNKIIAPILRKFFGSELPNAFLNKDNLVCEYVKEEIEQRVEKVPVEIHSDNSADDYIKTKEKPPELLSSGRRIVV